MPSQHGLGPTWERHARQNTAIGVLIIVGGLVAYVGIVIGFGLPAVLALIIFVAGVLICAVIPIARGTWGDAVTETEESVALNGAVLLPDGGNGRGFLGTRPRPIRGTLTLRSSEIEWQPSKPSSEKMAKPFRVDLGGRLRIARSLQLMGLAVTLPQDQNFLFVTSRHTRGRVERALERVKVATLADR